jgi:broad specificity phosphatase PhoE
VTLLLVRHGESAGNALRVMQGWADFQLSEAGLRQAEVVAHRLASAGATRLYASTLQRAWQTAELIGAAARLEVEPVDAFREYHLGEAQGLAWDDVVARFSVSSATWGTGLIPGEEGTAAFHARLTVAFDELAERHRDDVGIVVSHGGAIARLVTHVLGAPLGAYLPFETPANTSITAVGWDRGRHVLASLNDACHLDDLE